MEWVHDRDGNRIESNHPDWSKHLESSKYICKHNSPRKFEYIGEIWHLATPRRTILVEKGSWFRTSFDDYAAALEKEAGIRAMFRKRTGYLTTMDHLEVFIEKI